MRVTVVLWRFLSKWKGGKHLSFFFFFAVIVVDLVSMKLGEALIMIERADLLNERRIAKEGRQHCMHERTATHNCGGNAKIATERRQPRELSRNYRQYFVG